MASVRAGILEAVESGDSAALLAALGLDAAREATAEGDSDTGTTGSGSGAGSGAGAGSSDKRTADKHVVDALHSVGEDGVLPIQVALRLGNTDGAVMLLSQMAPTGAVLDGGATLAHVAVSTRHPDIDTAAVVAALVAHGASLDAQDDGGSTPIAYAAQFGLGSTIEALLDAGADAAIPDEDGDFPLHCAAHVCSVDAYRTLAGSPSTNPSTGTTALAMFQAARKAWQAMPPSLDAVGFQFARRNGSKHERESIQAAARSIIDGQGASDIAPAITEVSVPASVAQGDVAALSLMFAVEEGVAVYPVVVAVEASLEHALLPATPSDTDDAKTEEAEDTGGVAGADGWIMGVVLDAPPEGTLPSTRVYVGAGLWFQMQHVVHVWALSSSDSIDSAKSSTR